MQDIPTRYNPKEVEERLYKFWEDGGFFHQERDPKKKPYTIVIPPPNITGILHMGHALNNTIQDILIRFKKMQGYAAMWVPGTDHAGIATQNVVERKLAAEGLKRQDLGRDEFLKRVWQWRQEYGTTITRQLRRLGCACDWKRERFTMDEGLSDAVLEVFTRLYEKGLIYRGNYIVNWCPRCQTALSDEESQHRDLDGKLYYIKYPLKDGKEHIVVATTRPETMLGDTAIAVNPKDKRYKALIGKVVILPIVNRELKIISDEMVDAKFGTGAVKVTPAHDPNDFEMGQKHKLETVCVMNPDGTMNKNALEYEGMDRFECREALLEDLKERKALLKIEDHKHSVGHCYRCHTVVEPYLSKQWFVKMKPLAKPAIEAVKKGKIKFHPSRWTKVYLNWMENIRDWCISRQIWWGHRIPVFYCKKCEGVIVAKIQPDKCQHCGSTDLYQDPDVLDTWFSSWLWPFSTLGWPQDNPDLKYFYPTSTLVTAQEIIFFWVARMIMAGSEFMGDIPFKDVYIHGTVRDETGTKMSKSLGNVIDPLEIIDEYGCDALRYSIISITAVGQDVFLSKEKFELGRNFANKLWNASRFVMMNLSGTVLFEEASALPEGGLSPSRMTLADRWILSRLYSTLGELAKSLDSYKFNEAAGLLYEFIWHEYCDWYIELSKSRLTDKTTQVILYKALEKSLRMLHPFMPFVTEEIWQNLNKCVGIGEHQGASIMVQPWPHIQKQMIDEASEEAMNLMIEVIQAVRNMRAELGVPLGKTCHVMISVSDKKKKELFDCEGSYIRELAKAEPLDVGVNIKRPAQSSIAIVKGIEIYIPLKGLIDVDAEKSRLSAQILKLNNELKNLSGRLKNKDFLTKAPKEIVEKEKEKEVSLKAAIAKMDENLKNLT